MGRSMPKERIRLDKPIVTSKFIEKDPIKKKDKVRRKTLPKMRNWKEMFNIIDMIIFLTH